jgi:hypothetical protein
MTVARSLMMADTGIKPPVHDVEISLISDTPSMWRDRSRTPSGLAHGELVFLTAFAFTLNMVRSTNVERRGEKYECSCHGQTTD